MAKVKKSRYDLPWLVKKRSAIQDVVLQLYEFDRSLGESEREKFHHVFGLLVGVAFSLWRAVFLALPERTLPEVLNDATEFLRILIETNNIGFPQDRDTQQWMGGYYNNNAVFRLHALVEDKTAWKLLQAVASADDKALFQKYHPNQQDHFAKIGALKMWEDAYEGLVLAFRLLKRAYGQK
jgi:hypothetical protein